MLTNLDVAPFPWFGGKRHAASLVWELLGDCAHYVEPFFGGGAVLLNRPHPCNRNNISETVNDADGLLVNFWRSVQWFPLETARAASWPVTEADKSARQLALLRWRDNALERLAGDAAWCDPVMGGWWAWAVSVHIGAFDGVSAWTADPVTGKIYKQKPVKTREPGVRRNTPIIGNNGGGICSSAMREPGVLDTITPEHGTSILDDMDWGQHYHDMVMPELIRWFKHLSARLRHVRIVNGDWRRVLTKGATLTLPIRFNDDEACAVFLDPPYADTANRDKDIYACESLDVAHDVRRWCLEKGNDSKYRIVLAGFDGEHGTALTDAGWVEYEWFKDGFMRGGMAKISRNGGKHQMHRERLWASPHCLKPQKKFDLFDFVEEVCDEES